MPENPYDKLDSFTSVITSDALEESNKIYEEIRRESEQTLTAAEDDALGDMFRYIKTEVSKIRNEAGRRVSHKMMENKRRLYKRRDEMTSEVLGEVTDKIGEYIKTPAYTRQMTSILFRVVDTFDADTVVFLRKEDMYLEPLLAKIDTQHRLEFHQGNFTLGGLQASCPSKKLQIDESFDTTLEDLRGSFAEMFGLELAD